MEPVYTRSPPPPNRTARQLVPCACSRAAGSRQVGKQSRQLLASLFQAISGEECPDMQHAHPAKALLTAAAAAAVARQPWPRTFTLCLCSLSALLKPCSTKWPSMTPVASRLWPG